MEKIRRNYQKLQIFGNCVPPGEIEILAQLHYGPCRDDHGILKIRNDEQNNPISTKLANFSSKNNPKRNLENSPHSSMFRFSGTFQPSGQGGYLKGRSLGVDGGLRARGHRPREGLRSS